MLMGMSLMATAQPMGDADKLEIGVLYPQATQISLQAGNLLQNNLLQAISLNGISATDSRFMVLPRVSIVEQTVTETAPPKFVMEIEVSLFLVDLMTQTVFNQAMISTKGIGNSADQAMLAAIRNISSRNSRLKTFIVNGKDKLLAYYDANADQIIMRTQAHIARGDYQAAMAEINYVPRASTDLFNKMSELLSGIPKAQQTLPDMMTSATKDWLEQLK